MKGSKFPFSIALIIVFVIIGIAVSLLFVYRASAEEIITVATLEYAPWTGKNLKDSGFVNHVITEAFQRRGYTAYLVGGCVRDLLLGKHPCKYYNIYP